MTTDTPSQAAIGRELGLSPASISKLKGLGMPVDTASNARDWRMANLHPGRTKRPSDAYAQALALVQAVAAAHEAGQHTASMAQPLRTALAGVPGHERDAALLPWCVMTLLAGDVLAAIGAEQPFTPALTWWWCAICAGEYRQDEQEAIPTTHQHFLKDQP